MFDTIYLCASKSALKTFKIVTFKLFTCICIRNIWHK